MPRVSAFSMETIQEAVTFAKDNSASAAAEKYVVSVPTIYGWMKKVNGAAKTEAEPVTNGATGVEVGSVEDDEAAVTKRTRAAISKSADAIAALRLELSTSRAENAQLKAVLAPIVAAALRYAAQAAEAN